MRRLLGILLLLTLLAAGCSQAPPRLPPLPADAVVLAFGDSLTRGTGAEDGAGYPEALAGLIGRRMINAGTPGETSAEGRERLPALLDRHRPDLVILCHGGNDLLQHREHAAIAADLAAMIGQAQQAGAAVVLVAVPEPGLFLKPAPFYAEVAALYKIPCEEQTLARLLGESKLKSDHIHLNGAGYRQLAEALQRLLKDAHAL